MAATPSYQLSDFQNENLLRMANKEHQLLMVLDPSEKDDEETKDRLTKQRQEVDDLVALGFIENKSGKFLEQIAGHTLQLGRGYQVFLITSMGFDMFNGPRTRPSN